jgi:hypothetical protein
MRSNDGYRYTVMKQAEFKEVNKKVNLINIPLDACITASSSQELADRLSFEVSLGEVSKFAPYVNVLPKAFDMPRFWSPERLELARDEGFLKEALAEDVRTGDPWALACVDSRANYLPDSSYSLTPVLDMINHDCTVKTSAKVKNGNFLLDVSADSIQAEESPSMLSLFKQLAEVKISYGDFTNLHTLVNYGFVESNNPCNTESFKVGVIRHPTIVASVQPNGSIDPVSVGSIRRILATPQELENKDIEGLIVPFLSERNEMDTYALLAGFLEESYYDAKSGAAAAREDPLIRGYLNCRAATLQKGLNRIKELYPDILG